VELGVTVAHDLDLVGVAVSQGGEARVSLEKRRRSLPQIHVHVVRHHLQARELRPLVADEGIEVLAPPVRVSRDRGRALTHYLATQVPPRRAAPEAGQVCHPVAQHVAVSPRNFDAAEDHQARRGLAELFQLVFRPKPVVFGDDDAVETDLTCPADEVKRVDLTVGRVPASVKVQVKLHHLRMLRQRLAGVTAANRSRIFADSFAASWRARMTSAPARPIRVNSAGGVRRIRRIASAVASTLPAGTSHPFTPFSTSSGTPAMYVPRTGRPVARASIIA